MVVRVTDEKETLESLMYILTTGSNLVDGRILDYMITIIKYLIITQIHLAIRHLVIVIIEFCGVILVIPLRESMVQVLQVVKVIQVISL